MFEIRDKMMTKSSKHVLDKGKNISQKKGKKKNHDVFSEKLFIGDKIKHLVCALKRLLSVTVSVLQHVLYFDPCSHFLLLLTELFSSVSQHARQTEAEEKLWCLLLYTYCEQNVEILNVVFWIFFGSEWYFSEGSYLLIEVSLWYTVLKH